jgi:hypothetical protein
MQSSPQLCLELIEQTLQHAAGFQLHAAKHKVLVIRDALADDQACCDVLLLKIDRLLAEAFVPSASRSAPAPVPSLASPEQARSAA